MGWRRPRTLRSAGGSPLRAIGRAVAVSSLVLLISGTARAQSMKVSATGFTDVGFGTLLNFQTTTRSAQNLCVYANSNGDRYSVRATGAGPGGSFVMYDGSKTLTYAVEWSDSPGQASGTNLSANTLLTGQVSSATNQNCTGSGGASTASLIVAVRPSDLSSALQGNYSGNLSVTVSPE